MSKVSAKYRRKVRPRNSSENWALKDVPSVPAEVVPAGRVTPKNTGIIAW